MAHHPEPWKTLRWISLLAAVVVLALLGKGMLESTVRSTNHNLQDGLDKVLAFITHSDTRIVEGRAEITEGSEISELALLELHMNATRSFENEGFLLKYLPKGTKQLIVKGHYRVTVGYKLTPSVSLRIVDGVPVASFPRPEILGVELLEAETLNEEEGWANRITAGDRDKLVKDLREQMIEEAKESGVLETVEDSLRTRLSDLLDNSDVVIEHKAHS